MSINPVSNSSTNSSNSANLVQTVNTNSAAAKDNKYSNDEVMKKNTKLMIGASALAAAVIGGVLLHKGISMRKAAKEAEKLAKDLKFEQERMPRLFNGVATEEEIATKLEEIGKLSPAEQKKAYENLGQVCGYIHDLKYCQEFGEDKVILRRGMKKLPDDVKKEMAEGNWIKAGELYKAHVQELPETFKAKNIGSTIEESISNVFGAETKVKPHTYDLSKEGEEIISQRNYGGYYAVSATKEGILYGDVKGTSSLGSSLVNGHGFFVLKSTKRLPIKDGAVILHGVNHEGKYVTLLRMPDTKTDTAGNPLINTLGFISKCKKPTPAQQDLLSLAQHPEKFDYSLIDKLTLKTDKMPTGAENMDYDLALSVIQSMAKG